MEGLEPIAGGELNQAYRATLAGGEVLFVKTRDGADREEYEIEAAGLAWLAEPGALRVPGVAAVGDGDDGEPPFLALRWVEPGRHSEAGVEELGRDLARVHRSGADAFGARPPGAELSEFRIGPLVLADREMGEWPAFYAEQRLVPTARLADERGALPVGGREAIDRLCERIAERAGPPEPPARLHGDLWSGNVLADEQGDAVLIDPAAYGGHREIDLAMLRLFGAPDERLFGAYEEVWPLAEGAAERVGLWQLFPLLVHAVLFGGGWGERAIELTRRYA